MLIFFTAWLLTAFVLGSMLGRFLARKPIIK